MSTSVLTKDIVFIMNNNLNSKHLTQLLQEKFTAYNVFAIENNELNIKEDLFSNVEVVIFDNSFLEKNEHIFDIINNKEIKTVLWLFNSEKEDILTFLKYNFDGYFSSQMNLEEIKIAMRHIISGQKYIDTYFMRFVIEDYTRMARKQTERPVNLLSKREWEILEYMVKGYTNKDLADRFDISIRTVKNHISSIFRKIKVDDRTNAVITAIRNNWVILD